MADISKLAVSEVTAQYLFANTPIYLYRKLRANETVKAFGDSTTPLELATLVAKIDRKRKRTPEDVAIAYSAIVAATFHSSNRVHEAFDQLRLRNLDWADTILRFWYATYVFTDTRTFTFGPHEAMPAIASGTPTSRRIILPGEFQ